MMDLKPQVPDILSAVTRAAAGRVVALGS
jgi:hypothetical protein